MTASGVWGIVRGIAAVLSVFFGLCAVAGAAVCVEALLSGARVRSYAMTTLWFGALAVVCAGVWRVRQVGR